jgi:hypothetical protein
MSTKSSLKLRIRSNLAHEFYEVKVRVVGRLLSRTSTSSWRSVLFDALEEPGTGESRIVLQGWRLCGYVKLRGHKKYGHMWVYFWSSQSGSHLLFGIIAVSVVASHFLPCSSIVTSKTGQPPHRTHSSFPQRLVLIPFRMGTFQAPDYPEYPSVADSPLPIDPS